MLKDDNGFYHLRSIAKFKVFLSVKDFETVNHAFVSSRLDYCNSLVWLSPLYPAYNKTLPGFLLELEKVLVAGCRLSTVLNLRFY